MQTFEIRHIGPLVETGRIPISQVMLLVGEQSTGKSTFIKILCFCRWVEKQIVVNGKESLKRLTHYNRFRNELKKFHHFDDDFFTNDSYIFYEGDVVSIEMVGQKGNAKITLLSNSTDAQHNVKLCFLPSERNLLSAIQNIENLYRSREVDVLFNYILEWEEARINFDVSHPLNLVFANQMTYHYDAKTGDHIKLSDRPSTIKPFYASSGVQSALPVQLLATYLGQVVGTSPRVSPSEYLAQVMQTDQHFEAEVLAALKEKLYPTSQSSDNKKKATALPKLEDVFQTIKNRLQYKSFHLFVEELEQNLFPRAQFQLIRLLITLLVKAKEKQTGCDSSLFLTTHSPYVLTALNVMMLVAEAYQKDAEAVKSLGLEELVLSVDAYSAYSIEQGRLVSLMDTEYHFIKGDFLDSISVDVDDYTYQLNEIIYGDDTEGEA